MKHEKIHGETLLEQINKDKKELIPDLPKIKKLHKIRYKVPNIGYKLEYYIKQLLIELNSINSNNEIITIVKSMLYDAICIKKHYYPRKIYDIDINIDYCRSLYKLYDRNDRILDLLNILGRIIGKYLKEIE